MAVDDNAVVAEDGTTVVDVLGNDGDVEGDALTVASTSDPTNGTVVVNGDNTVTYTPDPDYNGPDSFTYTASDGNGGFDTATVTVTVVAVNDAPTAGDVSPTTAEDNPVTIDVVAVATDPDGDPLTVTATSAPAHGTVVINGDGTVTYTPNAHFAGTDTFTVTVCDPGGLCDVAVVSVTITPVNDAPLAVDDTVTLLEDFPAVIMPLGNDSDIEGDALTLVLITDPAHGTAAIVGSGTISYVPDPEYSGPDSFSYTIEDGNGGVATASVLITVEPVNDAPSYPGPTTVVIAITGQPPALPAVDVEGDPVTYSILSGTLPPGLTLNPDGTWSGAATEGTYVVTIQACDDRVPPACSTFSLILQVSLLPATGVAATAVVPVAVTLLLAGLVLVRLPGRRHDRAAKRPLDR